MVLSVVIPCYNEQRTLAQVLERFVTLQIPDVTFEVIVVDDASRDGSVRIGEEFQRRYPSLIRLLRQPRNQGKGAAVRRGFAEASGDLIVIQDADLEYDPSDFSQMISLFSLPEVEVVFGSRRLLRSNPVSGVFFYWGAQMINLFTNFLFGARISDQFTCYKMFRRRLLKDIPLHSDRFEIDAELTAKMLRLGTQVQEVPIHYYPRTLAEGKKIRFRDGLSWTWQLIKHRFSPRTSW